MLSYTTRKYRTPRFLPRVLKPTPLSCTSDMSKDQVNQPF